MAKATKLAAVNTIISNIGQAPVTSLETGNPLVELAEQVLDEISRSVQSEGWVFNSEYEYPFVPAQDKTITIPGNILSIDTGANAVDQVVIRDGKLYNKTKHSYAFEGVQKLDVIWLLEFEDMPEAFKNYVTIRAANVFAGRSVGSVEAVRFGEREEIIARASALEYDTQQGDYSIFADRSNNNAYLSYIPINSLYRY